MNRGWPGETNITEGKGGCREGKISTEVIFKPSRERKKKTQKKKKKKKNR